MSAEWDDLARLAEAATPGPWEHDGYAGIDSEESPSWIAHLTTYDPGEGSGNPRWRADAEFIAAANPATILRLISRVRASDAHAAAWAGDLREVEAEREALAARLAAVEALLVCDCGELSCVREQIRAALSAAPTDTTKETDRE